MAEQVAFEQVARNRPAVDADERPLHPAAAVVDLSGDQLLAGSALSLDQDRGLTVGHAVHHLEDAVHLLGRSNDRLFLVTALELALEVQVLASHPPHLERVADHQLDLVVLGVLDQVLERPHVHRVDRRLLRGIRGHDDDRQRWIVLLETVEQLDAVYPRHLDVGDDDIEVLAAGFLQRVSSVVHGRDLVALLAEHDAQELGHALFVVDDQDLFRRHCLYLSDVQGTVRPHAPRRAEHAEVSRARPSLDWARPRRKAFLRAAPRCVARWQGPNRFPLSWL